jgi:hypothetical protein
MERNPLRLEEIFGSRLDEIFTDPGATPEAQATARLALLGQCDAEIGAAHIARDDDAVSCWEQARSYITKRILSDGEKAGAE